MPAFTLPNTRDDQLFDSSYLSKNKGKLIMFICNHCPYVIHYHDQIVDVTNAYQSDIESVAISSNDVVNYPAEAPDKMKALAEKLDFSFPYLYDETQEIAKKYQAVCTPEFYLFDQQDRLIYRGRMDASSPGSGKSTGEDLRHAIDCFLSGKKLPKEQQPSMGCNIKWK